MAAADGVLTLSDLLEVETVSQAEATIRLRSTGIELDRAPEGDDDLIENLAVLAGTKQQLAPAQETVMRFDIERRGNAECGAWRRSPDGPVGHHCD